MELRLYQAEVIEKIEHTIAEGQHRIINVAPTGAGKTIIAAEIIQRWVAARKNVLVLAHTREIIKQISEKLFSRRIMHGVIQAGFTSRPLEHVQVASIQTLWTRAMRTHCMELPRADLLVIDECHHCPANTYRSIIESYPGAVLLGLTATPCRGDGRGLGSIFDIIIECPQVATLIEEGYLVKTKVYAPVDPDLHGVRSQAGDYVETQLAERMDRPNLIGDIVTHWHRYAERRKTVCFAVNVPHAMHIRDEFVKSGVRVGHIDGDTPKYERDAVLARLACGEIELISNCMVLTEGWDMPEVGCCILARPTKKMGLYRQMVGRILRPAEGKVDAIVLDHSGAVFRHGFVEDHVEWMLDPDSRASSSTHVNRPREAGSRLLECCNCKAVRIAGEACSFCGFRPKRPPRDVPFDEGELGLVRGGRRLGRRVHGRRASALSRNANRDRIGKKLQARVGVAHVSRKIRCVAPYSHDHADRALCGGPLMDSFTDDRPSQKTGNRRMSPRGQERDFGRLARRAERKMQQWRATLTMAQRGEIGELTRQERVSLEIDQERRERARRTVAMTVAASTGEGVTTGPTHSAVPVRKAGGRVAAESLRSQVAADSPGENGCDRPR